VVQVFLAATVNAACQICGGAGHNTRTCPSRHTAVQVQQQEQGQQQGQLEIERGMELEKIEMTGAE